MKLCRGAQTDGLILMQIAMHDWRLKGLGSALHILQGFKAAIKKLKLASPYGGCQQTVERAYWATRSLLKEDPRITAIMTIHNAQVVGAIIALQETHREVPDDSSIMGIVIGNESELIIPPPTSIEYSSHEIGQQVAEMLIQKMVQTWVQNSFSYAPG
jgi:DNA-binding LacI/PurR family transcriptional regulator